MNTNKLQRHSQFKISLADFRIVSSLLRQHPILCFYYITYRCNARCVYCDFWQRPEYRHSPLADPDQVKENLHWLKRLGIVFVDFTGGEPLLHPHLADFLFLAKKLGLRTTVTTNCLLYPQKADKLRGLVNFLHFSMDGLSPETNSRLRGVPLQQILKSIHLAQSLGERPDILFTLTNDNFQQLPSLAKFAQSHQLMVIVNPVFSYFDNPSLHQRVIAYLRRYEKLPYVYVNRAFSELILHDGNQTRTPRCRAVTATVVISPQNEILLPCFHFANQKLKLENLPLAYRQTVTFNQAVHQQGRYPFCENCTINCYFDPSFLYKVDRYFFLSLWSKFKYARDKYLRARTPIDLTAEDAENAQKTQENNK